MGDLHTPVSIYLKLRDSFYQSALLESSDFHVDENSISYIALKPIAMVELNRGVCRMRFPDSLEECKYLTETFTISDALGEFMNRFELIGDVSCHCGLFGYSSFNSLQYMKNINIRENSKSHADTPDMLYLLYKYILIFNHYTDEITLIELLQESEVSSLQRVESMINQRNFASYNFFKEGVERSTISDEQFRQYISLGVEHCRRGDLLQIVLSRRFVQPFSGDDFKVYRALRSINPSPYLFYFDFGGFRIFGSSPETHCKIEGDRITIDPIAGTTKRTGNYQDDMRGVEFLLNDPKENEEHNMLVDQALSDLSRDTDEVGVEFFKQPRFYSHVIHLVSRVSGTLKSDVNRIKLFFDLFPAGTVSGAPKSRAIELISEIESHNRGVYGGSIGFVAFNGNLNQAIAIRTFVSKNNELWYQAGAGVVAQSNDQYELNEVNSKLNALKLAIDKATTLFNS